MLRLGKQLGRAKRRSDRARSGEDGYAAVDALVALMIFATTLICALSATHSGRQAGDLALELRQARDLAAYLLETAPSAAGSTAGEANGFAWLRTVSEPINAFGAGAICERRIVLTGLRDQRRFETRTNAVCPAALDI